MPHAAYPTEQDLAEWLGAAGFSDALIDALDLETAVGAGIAAFEELTGRVMLAETGTRTFDLPYHPMGVIDLGEDLASASAVALAGTAQADGTGFRLLPLNAAARGRPYAQIQLPRAYFRVPTAAGAWGQVSVTGLWGYAATIPDDAWQAMLALAGLSLFPQIQHFIAGGMVGWKEADVSEQYGNDPLAGLRAGWQALAGGETGAAGVVARYRRVTVG